jgi:hypothetical protein
MHEDIHTEDILAGSQKNATNRTRVFWFLVLITPGSNFACSLNKHRSDGNQISPFSRNGQSTIPEEIQGTVSLLSPMAVSGESVVAC